MTLQYRICHNCGASLTPDQAYCPRCGAQYIEPVFQEPVVPLPPQQAQVPYQQQGQGYAQPPTSSPYYPSTYGQQAHMAPGQVGGTPQPPSTQPSKGISPLIIIAIVVVVLLLLVGTGGLFYHLGQREWYTTWHDSSSRQYTCSDANPRNQYTRTTTPTPKITPGTTPTATAFRIIFIVYNGMYHVR